MTLDPATGVWSVRGTDLDDKFYNYAVTVFNPTTGKVSTKHALNPYGVCADGRRSACRDTSDDSSPRDGTLWRNPDSRTPWTVLFTSSTCEISARWTKP